MFNQINKMILQQIVIKIIILLQRFKIIFVSVILEKNVFMNDYLNIKFTCICKYNRNTWHGVLGQIF
jgi:hypothetical protein